MASKRWRHMPRRPTGPTTTRRPSAGYARSRSARSRAGAGLAALGRRGRLHSLRRRMHGRWREGTSPACTCAIRRWKASTTSSGTSGKTNISASCPADSMQTPSSYLTGTGWRRRPRPPAAPTHLHILGRDIYVPRKEDGMIPPDAARAAAQRAAAGLIESSASWAPRSQTRGRAIHGSCKDWIDMTRTTTSCRSSAPSAETARLVIDAESGRFTEASAIDKEGDLCHPTFRL